MKNSIILIRNKILGGLYRATLKPIFFHYDPEDIHDVMIKFGSYLGRYKITQWKINILYGYKNKKLEQEISGIKFPNPIGLSAGFDKNAELVDIISCVGFGYSEVGSITALPCGGNPKPRLWRLPKSKGLVVYYGLKNDGATIIAKDLFHKKIKVPIGTSIAMTNNDENIDINNAIKDYCITFKSFAHIGAYTTINISCPNTCGGQPFIEPEALKLLLTEIDKIETSKPVLIKLSPDLPFDKIDELIIIAKEHRVHGIICTNLTKKRDTPLLRDNNIPNHGGISGLPVQKLSDEMIAHIYKKEGKRFIIIGSGGIFTAEDAYRKIRLGASLLQIITGMIYEGPQVISEINRGLAILLTRDGYKNISEVIGIDA